MVDIVRFFFIYIYYNSRKYVSVLETDFFVKKYIYIYFLYAKHKVWSVTFESLTITLNFYISICISLNIDTTETDINKPEDPKVTE